MYWMWLLLCQWLDKLLWEQKCIPYSLGVARQSCFLLWRVVLAFGFGRSLAFGLLEMKSSEQFFILNAFFIARHKTSVLSSDLCPFKAEKIFFLGLGLGLDSWLLYHTVNLNEPAWEWENMNTPLFPPSSPPPPPPLTTKEHQPYRICVNCAPILLVDIVGWYSD